MFTSYDSLIAAITSGQKLMLPWQKNATTAATATVWYHMWPVAGQPQSGSYAGINIQWTPTTDTTIGALYHGGNVSPATKHLIYAMVTGGTNNPTPMTMLIDQVGYYPLTQLTSSQVFDNTTNGAPSRYCSSGQPGLQVMLVNTAAMGGSTSNITALTYVNQSGTAGHSMPTTPTVVVTSNGNTPTSTLGAQVLTRQQGAGPFLPLAPGDTGVRSLTNITFSAANSGNMALVLCKPLAMMPIIASTATEKDFVMQVDNLERIYDGACLTWLVYYPTTLNSGYIWGEIDVAWGS